MNACSATLKLPFNHIEVEISGLALFVCACGREGCEAEERWIFQRVAILGESRTTLGLEMVP